MNWRLSCLLLLFLATTGHDRLAAADNPYIVDVWGTADGLPQSSVIALAQTRDGYLWLGTLNGLVRFDGNAFTRFNVNNTPGLTDNRVIFLFEDSRQNLWVGTETAGLVRFRGGVAQSFSACASLGKITFATEDEKGVVWFSTAEGNLFCCRNEQLELHPRDYSPQLFYRAYHLRVPGKNGVTWHLQEGRGSLFRGDQQEQSWGASPWPSSPITAVHRMPDGSLVQIPFDAQVTDAKEDNDGNLVVGTRDAGVFRFNAKGGYRQISTEQGLSHKTVLSLCCDTEGNLWVGTDGGGLNRIKKRYFVPPASLHPWVAQSAAGTDGGDLWVAFNGQGVSCWRTNGVQDFRVGVRNNAWAVLVDRRQQVWVGTRGEGLFRFSAYFFQPVAGLDKVGPQIYALLEARDGAIWAGGDGGLGGFAGGRWKTFSESDGLPKNAVRALAEDAAGNLWIGTEGGGLFCLRDGKISGARAPVKDIACLTVDRTGVLWAGTSGHGLARYENGSWSLCSTLHGGLASDNIGYILDDDAGNLWLGSYEGLLRVEKKSLADFARGSVKTVFGRTFLTRECSIGAQPAAHQARDGLLWFPTTEGLIAVNPADLKPNTNPPPVVIESILVDGATQPPDFDSAGNPAVTLTPENEQLELRFTSLNFSAPKGAQFGARFKFRLEGRDKNWTDAGGERVAYFNRLAPGRYLFHVIACNEDGIWNNAGAGLVVIVKPPFWRQPWFIGGTALAMLGTLAGIVYLISTAKLKRQLQRARQKELIELERSRIARDLHDQLGANLTQVALLGELAEADKALPDEVAAHAQQISATARETTRSLDEIVWAVNPANDTLEGLVNYVGKYAQDYFAMARISYRPDLPTQLPATPILPEVRHNVFLAFKEAVNNVVKHSQATEARVRLQCDAGRFVLSVEDNGRGIGDLAGKEWRNGLKNMRKRLTTVHGTCEIGPGSIGGTSVKFIVPLG